MNKKIVLSSMTVAIVVLISLIFIVNKNKDPNEINKLKENNKSEEQIKCESEGGFWQHNCIPYDDNWWCCAKEDKNTENIRLINKKNREKFGFNYFRVDNEIFVGAGKLEKFDLDTFTVLGDSAFAKDKDNIYVDGDILSGADLETFVIGEFDYNYSQLAMDKNNLYLYDWEKGDFSIKQKNEKGDIFEGKYYKKDKLIENTIHSKKEAEIYFKKTKNGMEKTLKELNSNNQVNKNNQKNNMNQQIPEEINMNLAATCQGVKIKTNKGLIEVKFYNEQAPTTVANFCTLASESFYDGIRFHRVIKDFMIQAGDPNSKDLTKKNSWGMGGPDYKFKDELPKAGEYKLGSLAMANSGPNTNGSQFFIISGEAGVQLPPLYSLFGEVVEGMNIVDLIQNVETEVNDRPVDDIIIESVEILEK